MAAAGAAAQTDPDSSAARAGTQVGAAPTPPQAAHPSSADDVSAISPLPPRGEGTTARGEDRRQAIVKAAAALIRESGPSAVSHRSVARRAGCSLSATTYYFDGLNDLLHQAGQLNIGLWASRAERVAEHVETLTEVPGPSQRIDLLLQATLPSHGRYLGHYLQLIGAGDVEPVGQAYREGRQRLNAALGRVLRRLQCSLEPEMVIAVVDGAAVTALSEGRDVKVTAARLLTGLIALADSRSAD